jgi:hypothetical protein
MSEIPANANPNESKTSQILADRQSIYGHPYDNFTRIARLWNAQFGTDFNAYEVSQAMGLVKYAREANLPTENNREDIDGYVECGRQVLERHKELGFPAWGSEIERNAGLH